jgi:hypothetical protein
MIFLIIASFLVSRGGERVADLDLHYFWVAKRPCRPLTVTLTVAFAVDVAVALFLHAESLVDVPPVVVPGNKDDS